METSTGEEVGIERDVEREAPRQAAAYRRAARRDAVRSRPAGGTFGRLQAVAVDAVLAEQGSLRRESIVARRARRL